jgi:hypothetical protein
MPTDEQLSFRGRGGPAALPAVRPEPVPSDGAGSQERAAKAVVKGQLAKLLGPQFAENVPVEHVMYGYPQKVGGVPQGVNAISGNQDDKYYSFDAPERAMRTFAGEPSNLDVAADMAEKKHGTLEQMPGWMNAEEYAKAGMEEGLPLEQARFLMSPERYQYMQNVGRQVDLLRNLAASPAEALHYWNKSGGQESPAESVIRGAIGAPVNPKLTRNDYWDPNYQRLAGAGNAAVNFMADSSSPLVRYLHTAEIGPNAIRFAHEGSSRDDSLARAKAYYDAQDRWRVGENPVMDLPTIPGEDPEAKARRFADRHNKVSQLLANLAPPSPQYVANKWFQERFGRNATPLEAFAHDTAVSAADPSLGAGLIAGIPGRIANFVGKGVVMRQLAKELPLMAAKDLRSQYAALARKMGSPEEIGQAVYLNTPLDLGGGAGKIAFRPTWAGAASRVPAAVSGEMTAQMVPEYAFGSALHGLLNASPERTYVDFASSTPDAQELDTPERERASHLMELQPQMYGKQSISDALRMPRLTPQPMLRENPF